MGVLERIREHARERRERKAAEAHAAALVEWQEHQDELAGFLEEARTFEGLTESVDGEIPIQLKKGERVFFVLHGAVLVEPKRERGHYQGGYSGVSFRVTKGVRVHTGGMRGTYVPGEEKPTAIEEGVVTITNQRVVFQGQRNARQWLFSKLIGAQHDPSAPWTALPVSNRQKVSGFLYDDEHGAHVRFRLDLALAHHADMVERFAQEVEAAIADHEEARPRLALPAAPSD